MKTIYHYTDIASLQSIVASSAIRCSDLRYLNDYQEVRMGQEALKNFSSFICEHFGKSKTTELIQAKLLETSEEPITAFAACFSRNGDQLSQWRGYGIDGKGVAIGFDQTAFEEAVNLEIRDVIYGSADLIQKLEPRIKYYIDEVERNIQKIQGAKNLLRTMKGELLKLIFTTKSNAFIEEEESRLIMLLSDAQKRKIEYRNNGTFLIPFIDLKIGDKMKRCVKSIHIGPSSHQQEVARSVSEFMRYRGFFSIDINTSSASYRV